MKKDAIQKHICELGFQSQLAPGVFYNLVCDAKMMRHTNGVCFRNCGVLFFQRFRMQFL